MKPQITDVSSSGSVLISCHKQLLVKLHVNGGSNSLIASTLLINDKADMDSRNVFCCGDSTDTQWPGLLHHTLCLTHTLQDSLDK
jgi:hypothetical protein